MKKRPFQLPPRQKRWLYVVAIFLFLSGVLWWLADLVSTQGWPGTESARATKPWLLKIHGAAAMASMFAVGTLWPGHIRRAWQAGQNRRSGATLLAWLAMLTVSGYGLYYFGDERVREWTAKTHDVLGLSAVAVLAAHVWIGHRSMRRAADAGRSRL